MPDSSDAETLNPLQAYNISRSIAATAVDIDSTYASSDTVDNPDQPSAEAQFAEARSSHDNWPFNSVEDLHTTVSQINVDNRSELVSELEQAVMGRLRESPDVLLTDSSSPSSSDTGDSTQSTNTTTEQTVSSPDPAASVSLSELDLSDLAQRKHFEIAVDLVTIFQSDKRNYDSIAEQHPTFAAPRPAVMRMEVTNRSSPDVAAHVQAVTEWVADIESGSQAGKRLSKRPMGATKL
ncbi:hypothetical protein EXE48_12020 [Halorubrum sp. ASP1]|jgi:hypothetical protein|uniref:hypothetical protein n=1 Tax=Halorubrum sp. ASP1 TaxID=2518114 RepID=UPI0010F95D91|nr:hypothetical protein [Halorubrum sp. ASP1]TKX60691.1 hypothetical protein EXE48_12020 [Halorubrum sp. ASP1]